ncbi:MAG TPA: hypothetical protein VH560_07920 [Polyangia bacterium]|jgi:hypothetical protein|nr:hypothetical protein [Polyangia bacterium]
MLTRRQALLSTLFGTGYVGLRALATGLPAAFLLNPRRALAANPTPACGAQSKAQYFVFNTCGSGDPINANVPGMYDDPMITHSADPSMVPTKLTLRGQSYTAAAPWASLPQPVLDRTSFWHMMTNTPVHPKEPDVLKLMGGTYGGEMLPSILAKHMAPCLGTIQSQPITIGATSPAEGLSFNGAALPIIPALALKATLTNPAGPLTTLQPLRDQTLNQLYDLYKNTATPAQKAYIDSLVSSQTQVRNINQSLLDALTSIKDNTADSQVLAAVTLIQMKVTPVISVHIPFGGDNHRDIALAAETAQTVAGVATIGSLMSQLATAQLTDQVTFTTLNVFGRTLGPSNTDGRQHNQNHQVSVTIGKPFLGGVVGAVGPVDKDFGALAVDSKTGKGGAGGDVPVLETLPSFGRTLLTAVGVDAAIIDTELIGGKAIASALA